MSGVEDACVAQTLDAMVNGATSELGEADKFEALHADGRTSVDDVSTATGSRLRHNTLPVSATSGKSRRPVRRRRLSASAVPLTLLDHHQFFLLRASKRPQESGAIKCRVCGRGCPVLLICVFCPENTLDILTPDRILILVILHVQRPYTR